MAKKFTDNFVEILWGFGFLPAEIKQLVFSFSRYKDCFNGIEEFKKYYINYQTKMTNLGYSGDQIRFLATNYPKAIFQTFSNGQLEEFYKKYLEKKFTVSNVDDNYAILNRFGFTDEKIRWILRPGSPISSMTPLELYGNLGFYLTCGFSKESLIDLISHNITYLLMGECDYSIIFDDFPFFTKRHFVQLLISRKKSSSVQPDLLYRYLKFAADKNLKKEPFIKCLNNNALKNVDLEYLEGKYQELIELGFSENDACTCVSNDFTVLYEAKEKFEYLFSLSKNFLISKEDLIRIVTIFPAFIQLPEDKILGKLRAVSRYGLKDYVIARPKNLIQGEDLIIARASYLRLFYPNLSKSEFAMNVFSTESDFKRRFDRDNKYLKELVYVLRG